MAALIYSTITSLDGYIADADGTFDWAAPDDEVHAFVNERERPVGTYLYGRRLYETMRYWQTAEGATGDVELAYAAIWQAADKIVYSRTLGAVSTARTVLAHDFDPAAVRRLKDGAERDISVGGGHLAAAALRAGVVDEIAMYLNPIVVGGGTRALPDDVRLELDLRDEHRFGNGVVYLHYRVR